MWSKEALYGWDPEVITRFLVILKLSKRKNVPLVAQLAFKPVKLLFVDQKVVW